MQTVDVLFACAEIDTSNSFIGVARQLWPRLKHGIAPTEDFSARLFVLEKRSDQLNCQGGTPEII